MLSPMRALRSVLFWTHLVAGVTAGAIILMMSATGVLLTYQRQLQYWADVRGLDVRAPVGARPLAADSLLSVIGERGITPTGVLWRQDPNAPVELNLGRDGRAYLDPYTGEELGRSHPTVRRAFSVVTDWHRWLAMSGQGRATGKRITGAANLAFLVLVLTGAWLWWPRSLTWRSIRQVGWFRRGLSAKARDFNWHHVVGLWTFVPLLVVVASGVVISYPWASRLVYRAVGDTPPPSTPAPAASTPASGASPASAREIDAAKGSAPVNAPVVGDIMAMASERVPEWKSISLAWPRADTAPLVYTIDAGTGGEPHKRGTLTVSRVADSTTWAPFASQSPGRRLRGWLRFLHTGEALGLPGQTLAGLVSLGAVLLVYTGLALSVRRLWAFVRRPSGRAVATDLRTAPLGPRAVRPAADSAPAQ